MYSQRKPTTNSRGRYAQKLDHEDAVKYSYLLGQINKAFFNEDGLEMPITVETKKLEDGTRATTIVISFVEKDEYHIKIDHELHKRCNLPIYS